MSEEIKITTIYKKQYELDDFDKYADSLLWACFRNFDKHYDDVGFAIAVGYILNRITVVSYERLLRTLAIVCVKVEPDVIYESLFETHRWDKFEREILDKIAEITLSVNTIPLVDATEKALRETLHRYILQYYQSKEVRGDE